MQTSAFVIPASLLLTVCAGCGVHSYTDSDSLAPSPVIVGSGRFVTETRQVATFSRISVTGAGHVIVTHSPSESLDVTAEDNLMALVDAAVMGDRLVLGWKPGIGSMTSHGVEFRVSVRELRGVDATGASRFDVDTVEGDFTVTLTGASMFSGSGVAGRLGLDVSGASRCQTPDLTGRVVTATVSGASSAFLRVVDSLAVTASGASTFEFLGDPAVQAAASGGSVVRRVGP